MMARTSRSRTSKLISVSAFTPPNANEMLSTLRTVSPAMRAVIGPPRSGDLARLRGKGPRFFDTQVRGHHVGPPVLEAHQCLDVLRLPSSVQRIDQRRIFFRDIAAPHLARTRELVVVGIEFLVQDQEAVNLRIGKL